MIRLFTILIFIALLSLGFSEMADHPGRVTIYWTDYRIETSLLFLLCAIAVLSLLCIVFYSIVYLIFHTPRSWMRAYLAKRQAQGLQALTEAFAAVATQDLYVAHKKLRHAQHYLPHQPITMMLAAQLAKLEGDETNARLYMEQMLGNDATKFMALRNLIENARNSNDSEKAITHCKQALVIKPHDNWVIATLAELYAKSGHVEEAEHLLETSLKKRYISKPFFRREYAYMLYENAKSLSENGRNDHAIPILTESLRHLPDFPHASTLLAELYIAEHKIKDAIKTVTKAWKISPYRQLRSVLLKILHKPENKQKHLSSVQKITKIHPEHEETRLLVNDLDNII